MPSTAPRRYRGSGTPGPRRALSDYSARVDLDLVFLGTAGSAPTAARGTSATLIRRGGDRLLVDCGEGTQRQLLRSDAGLGDLEDVFLTHLHADHVLGLPGMLKTFSLRGRETTVTVHGPRGTRSLLERAARRDRAGSRTPSRCASSSRATRSSETGTASCRSRSRTALDAIGYALREDGRPGRFEVDAAERARRPGRPGARRAAARRGGHARLGPRDSPGGGRRPAAAWADDRA